MSLRAILEETERHAKRVMETGLSRIDGDLVFPEGPGVYLIYKNGEVVYVGQSTGLKDRFKEHLSASRSIRGSAFRRDLVREHYVMEPEETKKWIMENCSISFLEIKDPDMCKLVESLLTAHFRKQNKPLLNS